jgi:DNA-binding IclR family transcriptional regulator
VVNDLRGRLRAGVHLVLYTATTLRVADVDPDLPLASPDLVEQHLHASAAGRLLLAEQPEWRELVPPSRLARLTPATVTKPDALDACLAAVRADGWAGQAGELHEGTACIAVPVRSADGELVAAVVVTSGRGQVPLEAMDPARACAADLVPLLT